MRKRCLQASKESTDSLLGNCCGLTELTRAVRWRKSHQALDVRATRDMRNIKPILRYLRVNPGIMTARPTTLNLEAVTRDPVGSVLTYGDPDWAGDADRISVNGTASWLRTASNRKQSTIELSSGEAELVVALSGACEGMSLRQRWNWLLKFGCNAEETNETTQQILCCDSSAAVDMIKREGSTRKTRHIELKPFFPPQWRARKGVRLVQVVTSEMLADCLTKIQSAPNSIHLSRLGLDLQSCPETDLNLVERIERWRV